MANFILLQETESTNTYLSQVADTMPSGTVIYTSNQLLGRGQRGNFWESEPNKNLTFSYLLKGTNLKPHEQFLISEAVSLAIVHALEDAASDMLGRFTIKWPNDIYYEDKKVCGILIEHVLLGDGIKHSVVGVGMNVNQEVWVSGAPNPISLKQITKMQYDVDDLLKKVVEKIEEECELASFTKADFENLHQEYLGNLYRYDAEYHEFVLPDGSRIKAKITNVEPAGFLHLEHDDGTEHSYAFKEIAFVI